MKALYRIVMVLFLAASAFASEVDEEDQHKAFIDCVDGLRNIFSQSAVKAGKDGIIVTCVVTPSEQLTSIAWEIENPNKKLLTISAEGARLYGEGGEFDRIETEEAIEILYKWPGESDNYNETWDAFKEIHNLPNEDIEEEALYGSAFKFGATDSIIISGIVYFSCRLKNMANVTAEIKVNNETFSFSFDGGGP